MSGAVFLAAMLPLMLWPMDAANAQCVGFPVQTNQTCTNGGTLADTSIRGIGNVGLQDLGTLSLTNTAAGVISSSGFSSLGIFANQDLNLTNSGSVAAAGAANSAVAVGRDATISNSGIIQADDGMSNAIVATRDANVINSGTISANGAQGTGIIASRNAYVINSGKHPDRRPRWLRYFRRSAHCHRYQFRGHLGQWKRRHRHCLRRDRPCDQFRHHLGERRQRHRYQELSRRQFDQLRNHLGRGRRSRCPFDSRCHRSQYRHDHCFQHWRRHSRAAECRRDQFGAHQSQRYRRHRHCRHPDRRRQQLRARPGKSVRHLCNDRKRGQFRHHFGRRLHRARDPRFSGCQRHQFRSHFGHDRGHGWNFCGPRRQRGQFRHHLVVGRRYRRRCRSRCKCIQFRVHSG
ncbi:hypothetical protein ACVWWP_002941 [Bradyrhizobium sp. LM3.6]